MDRIGHAPECDMVRFAPDTLGCTCDALERANQEIERLEREPFDLRSESDRARSFQQWKNTKVCMDFYCECGAHCHFDGYFAYAVKCPHCETVWQMPSFLYPREASADYDGCVVDLEPDEDIEPVIATTRRDIG